MNNTTRKSRSRRTVVALALSLAAAFTLAFLVVPHPGTAASPPLPCAAANNNGCTELSATPPQDTQSVPPNITLMLDDSGSMAWDFMPDIGFLTYNWGTGGSYSRSAARNPLNNSLYYNPAVKYVPPPYADSTTSTPHLYPDSPSITGAYDDPFKNLTTTKDVTAYQATNAIDAGNQYPYYSSLDTVNSSGGSSVLSELTCPGNYTLFGLVCKLNALPATKPAVANYGCPAGYGNRGSGVCCPAGYTNFSGVCKKGELVGASVPQLLLNYTCPSGYSPGGNLPGPTTCTLIPLPGTTSPTWYCPNGGTHPPFPPITGSPVTCTKGGSPVTINVFTYVIDPGSPVGSPTPTLPSGSLWNNMQYYISAGTAGNNCSLLNNAAQKSRCVDPTDISGAAAPAGVAAGQNAANWFSYYRTRLLMTKTGLMNAFVNVDGKYRFGFGSINANGIANIPGTPTPFGFDDSMSNGLGGSASNKLAVVQPFGDGTSGTQKALFWKWIASVTANNQTPLRKALEAVGKYYESSQPWKTMSTDPGYTVGSTTEFACRASYTILTTDGFWNGDDPTTSGLAGATAANGPNNAPVIPASGITQYTPAAPYSGPYSSSYGAVAVDASGSPTGSQVASLADVATYYWAKDLQPTMSNEVGTSTSDPAAWQHMTTFTIGLGFKPVGIQGTNSSGNAATVADIFSWALSGAPITGFSWPTAYSNGINNIADLAHTALNGHGDFFNVTKPQDLADALGKAFTAIAARTNVSPSSGKNTSVLSMGAVSFSTAYETTNWSGAFKAVGLNPDGTADTTKWDAGASLNTAFHSGSGYSSRKVWTSKLGASAGLAFNAANLGSLDASQTAGLSTPALLGGSDTLANRVNFLLGDPTYEGGIYRARPNGILGAIIRSQPVYVAGASGGYYDNWPTGAPENSGQTFDAFVTQQKTQPGMAYVGANDGMLHAFYAPIPSCTYTQGPPPVTTCNYNPSNNAGSEAWAFVPRAVYANLGRLTGVGGKFEFLPTVDATPKVRDVFFSDSKWHTLLASGVGMGGRGVFGLDISKTAPATFAAADVKWEFDSDTTISAGSCVSIVGNTKTGTCDANDLGYTVSQPNIGRINYSNKWVVLVPNGYFPDCTTPDLPTATSADCALIAAQAPGYSVQSPFSALFVLDAETGKVIAELKTPALSGVTSFGLSSPVFGNVAGGQVDEVAFAGDMQGNLWRFDLTDASPANWKVTLAYQAPVQGAQPITTMPRLLPDPTTNRFMVVFGTGRFLGVGDNGDNTVQAVYGIRDVPGTTWTRSDLTQQFLHEETPASGPYAGVNLRCVTGSASDTSCTGSPSAINNVPATAGGWYFNLQTKDSSNNINDAGERVVATPAANFSTSTVVIGTLITGSQSTNVCSPSTVGSVLVLNALTGGSAGVSSLGGGAVAGARVTDAQTSGSVSIGLAMGGGLGYVPGLNLAPSGSNPMSYDAPIWRRRSWNEINQ